MAKKITFESTFDRYRSSGVIGEGGSGRVFRVTNEDDQLFALKVLSASTITTEKIKRFKNEIEFCKRHVHPNLVPVIDYGYMTENQTKCPFYVMPLYDGTLRSLQERQPEDLLRIFSQVLDGVEAAHLCGVYHRDLKPENILWDETEGHIVIADFGIAHFEEEDLYTAVETKAVQRLANFQYAAPEQRSRGKNVDHRADLYALGLILNELLTGEVPQGTEYKQVSQTIDSYGYLDEIVEKLIRQDPDQRYQSVAEIKAELIGREKAFIALQRLEAETDKVVESSSPAHFDDIEILSLDFDEGVVKFQLSRNPPGPWIQEFKSPRGGHGSILGHGPETFGFSGSEAIQPIGPSPDPKFVQQIVDHFKNYVSAANKNYRLYLKEVAVREETARRKEHEARIKSAESKKNILEQVKL